VTIPPSLLTKRLIQERPLYERQGPPVSLLCPTFRHIAAEVYRAGSAPRINELPGVRRGRATRDDAGRALPPPRRNSARVPVPPGFVPAAPLPSSLTRNFDRLLAVKIPSKSKSCAITPPGARAPRTSPRRALTVTAHHSSQRPIAPSVRAKRYRGLPGAASARALLNEPATRHRQRHRATAGQTPDQARTQPTPVNNP
jgi:hypothetical protein